MSFVEDVQKVLPWAQQLPLFAKITLTAIVVFTAFLFLSLVWVTPKPPSISSDPTVLASYDRMLRVLNRLQKNRQGVFVDGEQVPKLQEGYWRPYIAIQQAIHDNPGDVHAAYEAVMENGGTGRVFTNDTESFEIVVSHFATEAGEVDQQTGH